MTQGKESAEWFRRTFDAIRTAIGKVVVGQDDIVEGVLIGLAANGNILLEGMPGLGKTLLVKLALFAGMLMLAALNRFQLTPALTGTSILSTTLRHLRLSLVTETLLALLVIAAVAVLGTLPPPV